MIFVLKHKPTNMNARWKFVTVDAEDSELARSKVVESLCLKDNSIKKMVDYGNYLIQVDYIKTNAARFSGRW